MAKGGCAAAILVLLLMAPTLVWTQPRGARQNMSVTILLDLSYSMRLPLSLNKDEPHGPSRLDEAKTLLREVIDGSAGDTQWSLVTFGGTHEAPIDAGPRLRLRFTGDRSALETEIAGLSTWGVSPLSDSILYAERYSDLEAEGRQRVLLVVSDGIDTMPSLFEMPSPHTLRRFETRVVFAGIALRDSAGLTKELGSWLEEAGGVYVDAADPTAVREAIRGVGEREARLRATEADPPADRSGSSVTEAPRAKAAGSAHADVAARGAHGLRPGRGIFLALAPLPLLLLAGVLFLRRRRSPPRRSLPSSAPALRFRYEVRDDVGERKLSELPAELTAGNRVGSTAPLVELREGRVLLLSAAPVLVNGVAVRRAVLTTGDRIRVGPFLWTFHGEEPREEGSPDRAPEPSFAPAAAAAVAVAVLLIFGLTPNGTTGAPAGDVGAPSALGSGAAGVSAPPGYVTLAGTPEGVRPFVHIEMIAPGGQPQFFKADVMFIHAHPDDDSIDFGGLMAVESRAGRRIVTVVFTDGNAGLDQYPNRRVGGLYPAHALHGNALAAVRVREADAALSILGAQEYIRLGLLNNPYESITEILPLHEVLRRWGGEAQLVRQLAGLIEGFRPEIVVSPDDHHRGVFKHFEHEAVGYLANRALAYLTAHGERFVRGHLIAVDPMLISQYSGVFGVDVMAAAPGSGSTYRAIQVAALKEHATQRDASVIGVEVVPNFADEYYVARSWSFSVPPRRYFAHLTSSGGG